MKKVAFLLVVSLGATLSQAEVAFSSFGPGDSSQSAGWGFGDLRDARVASQFTSSVSGRLNFIKMALQQGNGNGISTVSLFRDSGNDLGALMAVYTVDVTVGGLKTITNSDPNLELVAGDKYWIESKAAAGSGVYGGWNRNNQSITGYLKFGQVAGTPPSYLVGSGNDLLPAFTVNVTPVPEPSTMVAMTACAALAALRRRKSN